MVAPRVKPMPWPAGEDARVAKCWALRGHEAPFPACNCGISAYYELDEEPDLPAPDAVWGAIVAWGRVVECETGFRAQYARPIGLLDAYNPLDFARPLKRAATTRPRRTAIPLLPRDELVAYAGWHGELRDGRATVTPGRFLLEVAGLLAQRAQQLGHAAPARPRRARRGRSRRR